MAGQHATLSTLVMRTDINRFIRSKHQLCHRIHVRIICAHTGEPGFGLAKTFIQSITLCLPQSCPPSNSIDFVYSENIWKVFWFKTLNWAWATYVTDKSHKLHCDDWRYWYLLARLEQVHFVTTTKVPFSILFCNSCDEGCFIFLHNDRI